MSWLALQAGDAATWGGTVVTFAMACFAIAQGVGQRRDLRRQNELQAEASQLQRRQIETAERRTLVMEQILAQLTPYQPPVAAPSPPGPPGQTAGAPWSAGPVPVQRPAGPPAMSSPFEPSAPFAAADVSTEDMSTEDISTEDLSTADAAAEEDADQEVDVDFALAERERAFTRTSEPDGRALPDPPADRPLDPPAVPPGPPGGYGYPQTAGPGYGYPQTAGPAYGYPQPSVPGDAHSAGQNFPPPPQQQPPPAPYMPSSSPWAATPPPVPSPPPAPPGIWRIERFGRHGFALRNTSAGTLTGVHISRENLPASARGVPEDSVVRPGETAEFLMAAERGQPLPDAVLVSWHGQPGPAYVPVPRS